MAFGSRMSRITFCVVLFLSILLSLEPGAGPACAQAEPQNPLEGKKVLILHALEPMVPVFEKTDRGLSAALQSGGIGGRDQFHEYLDLARNPGPEYRQYLAELMRLRYGRRKIDLIITLYPEALLFALKEGRTIFPDVPIVALYLPEGFELPHEGRRVVRQFVTPDIGGTLDLALKLVPEAKLVYVVGGTHSLDRWLENEARRDFKQWEGRLEFRYLNNLPFEETLAILSDAPQRSLVIVLAIQTDITGRIFTTREVCQRLGRVSKAPVFGLFDTLLGHGIAGGSLFSFEYIGTKTGELTLDILRGTQNLENIPVVLNVPSLPLFDWRQLRHWNLDEDALPEGSFVLNRESTIWDHKDYIIGVLIFITAQSLLIIGLLVQKRRRRSAEQSLSQTTQDLDQFFTISLDPLCIANTDGYFLRLNPSWEKTLGYDCDELMSKQFLDFVHPDDLPATQDAIAKLVSQKAVVPFVNRYQCKDGTYRWLEWSAAPAGDMIYATARDVTEQKLAEHAVQERLRFEQLLSDLSAKFVNLPPERVDSEIAEGLRQVLEFFQVDRAGLLRTLPGKSAFQITHIAYAEGVPPLPAGAELPISIYPWAYEELILRGQVVAYSRLDDLPPEAHVDKQTWTKWGVRSNVNVPILIGEPVDHVISINSVKSERVWPEKLFPRLQLLGEIFVNALERKHSRLETEEHLRFECLISDLSAGFVNLRPEEVDSAITRGLRSITEFFDVDRCTIGIFSEDGNRLVRVFEYLSPGAESAPEAISREQMPWYLEQLIQGKPVVMNQLEDLPPEAEKERQICHLKSMKSVLSVPMVSGGRAIGSCALVATRKGRVWPEELLQRFRLVTEVFANAMQRKRMEEQLSQHLCEIEDLKQRLENENVYLQEEIKVLGEHTEIVGQSRAIKRILAQAEQVARTDSTVLIVGETGTGKELLARAIHNMSTRKDRPMITVNCASLPPTLIEGELFGREKGAYTGALTKMIGRFEVADGSTLFLDEIGELPLELQSKLLRVLEEGNFERLGSTKTLHVNVRIVAATNRDIAQDVREEKFRKDLYYRLNVFPISIPPLRERPEDIPLLVWAFIKEFEKKVGKRIDSIPKKSMDALQRYSWPGNIRELRNVIEHGMILSSGRTLAVTVPHRSTPETADTSNLEHIERSHLLNVLKKTNWRIAGEGGAAEILGLKRTTLQSLMKRLGIKRPDH
jgi:formate hydrogenlyase transcriptional activator